MFAALRKDWEVSEFRPDAPALPLTDPQANALNLIPLEEKLRARRTHALKAPIRLRLHDPLANCTGFQSRHLAQALESSAVSTVAVRAHHAPRVHIPRSPPLPQHFLSLVSRRFRLGAR